MRPSWCGRSAAMGRRQSGRATDEDGNTATDCRPASFCLDNMYHVCNNVSLMMMIARSEAKEGRNGHERFGECSCGQGLLPPGPNRPPPVCAVLSQMGRGGEDRGGRRRPHGSVILSASRRAKSASSEASGPPIVHSAGSCDCKIHGVGSCGAERGGPRG